MNEITDDAWELIFQPIKNSEREDASFNGTLFSFGQVEKEDVMDVWTLVEADGQQYITPGFATVNRLGYFITEVQWTNEMLNGGLQVKVEDMEPDEPSLEFAIDFLNDMPNTRVKNKFFSDSYAVLSYLTELNDDLKDRGIAV